MIRTVHFTATMLAGLSVSSLAMARDTLPQIKIEAYPGQIFWLIVTFVIFYLVISRVAMPRISMILQNRMRRIDSDLSAARKYRREIETSQKEIEASLAKARQEAQDFLSSKNQSQQEQFQQQLATQMQTIVASINEKEANIAAQKREALNSLDDMATELVEKCVVLAGGKKPPKSALVKAMKS